ncbi:MAG: hypothetical protein WCN88_01305 [Candidatus Falkowbacteria bacterium]
MKTSDLVNRSAKYSWYYLLLAVLIFFVATKVKLIYGVNVSDYQINDTRLWLYLAASFYLVNWICGAFYFPIKYRKVLNRYWLKDAEHLDLSFMRGYIAAIITFIYFIIPCSNIGFWAVPLSIIWLCLHILLAQTVRTDKLFKRTSVMINELILMPFITRPAEIKGVFTNVEYILPLQENKEEWIRKTVVAYASHRRAGYFDFLKSPEYPEIIRQNEAERLKRHLGEQEASDLSANIYNYCN